MYCDNCDLPSFSSKTTIRHTKDGREIVIQHCGNCNARVEIEFKKKGSRTRIKNKKSKKSKV